MGKEYKKKPIQDRFMAKVFVPDDPDACWEWKASKNKYGYGQFSVNGKFAYAHRLSYELFCGEITKEMYVCHKCDNRICVNPRHLFLGTPKDNVLDMFQKGRSNKAKGSKHPFAKLKEDDVLKIRKLLKTQLSQTEIGKMFGVGQARISMIKCGKNWCHVP